VSNSNTAARWVGLAAALALLNLALTFVNVWPTLTVRVTAQLSLETAALVLGLALTRHWRGPLSRAARRSLAVVWVFLTLGHYVDVSTRSLYGRSVNLYWDFKLLPDVGAMFAFVADPWILVAVVVGVVLLPVLVYLALHWAIGCVSDTCGDSVARRALIVVSVLVLSVAAAQRVDGRLLGGVQFSPPVAVAYAQEGIEFFREVTGLAHRILPPAPVINSDLALVQGADVFVLFLESYGATSWDRPEFRDALADARAMLERDISDTGREVVSAFVESTTFGGESWLAHISLLSGTEVRDPDTNMRLMTERRDTLVTAFARQGYSTAAIMPGLQRGWPEGGFYGFDRIYGTQELGYRGPPFGWWDITDQYALARMDELVIAPQPRSPAFVFLPTISTHAPFTPAPPYQPDWARALTSTPHDPAELDSAWAEPADWTNLGPGYAKSLIYVHKTLGGYLRLRGDRDFVMVVLGDHQPPALVSGEGASWDVPVHVVASRREVLDRLLRQGFREGLTPQRPIVARMDTLMPILLGAFGDPE